VKISISISTKFVVNCALLD